MDYKRIYDLFIDHWKNINLPQRTKGTHTHHIVAKSLGGSNDNSNLVTVPYRVHFILHRLYAKFDTTNTMSIALAYMSNSIHSNQMQITSRTYEQVFNEIRKIRSSRNKAMYADPDSIFNSIEYREKLKNSFTDERRKKRANHLKSKWNDPEFRDMVINRNKSDEHKQKVSLKTKGKKNPAFDPTIRVFKHKITNEVFIGTRFDFINKYNLSASAICMLIKGTEKSVKKWTYEGQQ